jgi:hypothetical protein
MSRLRKNEREALAEILMSGAETPEELAQLVADKLDELRGERTFSYACMIVAGIPMAVGPFATANQAQKAADKAALADKVWIVSGWTPDGFAAHLAELDKAPEPHKPNAKEQRARDRQFWSKVRAIEDGEATAIVGKSRRDIEIRAFPIPKGAWG